MRRPPFVLLVLLLLLGCTAEPAPGGAAPAPTPTETVPPLPAQVSYVALGDSLATGAGATTSYVEEFAALLEAEHDVEVEVTNLARDGWTSGQLLTALEGDEEMREAVAGADVLTVDIGGNDLLQARFLHLAGACGPPDDPERCLDAAVAGFEQRWPAILDVLLDQRASPDVWLRTHDLYHPFVAQERARGTFEDLLGYLEAFNATLHAEAAARDVPVAEVRAAFNADTWEDPVPEGLISDDGLHPSEEGHRVIAEALASLGGAP